MSASPFESTERRLQDFADRTLRGDRRGLWLWVPTAALLLWMLGGSMPGLVALGFLLYFLSHFLTSAVRGNAVLGVDEGMYAVMWIPPRARPAMIAAWSFTAGVNVAAGTVESDFLSYFLAAMSLLMARRSQGGIQREILKSSQLDPPVIQPPVRVGGQEA